MMRGLLFALGLILPLAACKEEKAAPLPPRAVLSETVDPLVGFGGAFLGEVSSRVEADLGFPVAGTMAERRVDAGALVAAGDILAVLDPTDLDANVRSAEAGIAVAQAQLNSAQDAADRATILLARGVDTQVDVDTAQQGLIAAKAKLVQAIAASVSAKETRSYATMTAPQAGVISKVYEDSGATVTAGQPVLRLSGTEELEVLIDATEQQLIGISPGDPFKLVLEANPLVTASAVLASIDPVANSATRTRRVHLKILTPPQGFRLGALVRVSPEAAAFSRITVPQSALRPDGTVWVVDRPAGTVRAVAVTTGDTLSGRVLISQGLAKGDEVVTRGIHSLTDGQIVGPQVAQ